MAQPANLTYNQYIEQARSEYAQARELFRAQQLTACLPALQDALENLLRAQIAQLRPNSMAAAFATWKELLDHLRISGSDERVIQKVAQVNELVLRLRQDSAPSFDQAFVASYELTVRDLFKRFAPTSSPATHTLPTAAQPSPGQAMPQPVVQPLVQSMPQPPPPASPQPVTASQSRAATGPQWAATGQQRTATVQRTASNERLSTGGNKTQGAEPARSRLVALPLPEQTPPPASPTRSSTGNLSRLPPPLPPGMKPPQAAKASRPRQPLPRPSMRLKLGTLGNPAAQSAADHRVVRWVGPVLLFLVGALLIFALAALLGLTANPTGLFATVLLALVVGAALGFTLGDRLSKLLG